jgi:hypothetical protein
VVVDAVDGAEVKTLLSAADGTGVGNVGTD